MTRTSRLLALVCACAVAFTASTTAAADPGSSDICNLRCDGLDVVPVSGSRVADEVAIGGTVLRLVLDDASAMGWGSLETSSSLDLVWLDRSFDGGRSREQLGIAAGGESGARTPLYNVDDPSTDGVGALRACATVSGGASACTKWARTAGSSSGRIEAAAAALAMSYDRSLNLFQTSFDAGTGPTWGGAVATSSLVRAMQATGTTTYEYVLARTFDTYEDVRNGSGSTGFRNDFSDDAGWWAMAWLDAYDLTGDARYLAAAQDGAAHMKTFWTPECGGGLRWRNGSAGKATISTTLYVQVNAALALRVPAAQQRDYVDEAVAAWEWLSSSPLSRGDHRYWDGLDVPACAAQTSSRPFTYHNGTLVSGLTSLARYYASVGDSTSRETYLAAARATADAITQRGADFTGADGIMRDPAEGWDGCESDGAYFKAAAARGLDELDRTLPDRPYRSYLRASADSAYATRNTLDQYSLSWSTWLRGPGQGCQASALALLATTTTALSVPSSVDPGTAAALTGSGFGPGEVVTFSWTGSPALTASWTATADESGDVATTVTLPRSTADGSYELRAVGATSALPATAAVTVRTVMRASVTSFLGVPATLTQGDAASASVRVTAGSTGRVTLFDGTTPLGTVALGADSSATFSLSSLGVGTHSLTAAYAGDTWYLPSTSTAVTVTVDARATVSVPVLSKASQAYGSVTAKRAKITATVKGVTSGKVTFRSGSKVLGTASVVKVGSAYKATLRLSGTLPVGSYKGLTATVVSGKTTVRSATSAATFKVVKATTSKVTVTGKKFTKGTKPTVSVKVATLSNGQVATGKVRVYVGGKLVKTVTLSAKNKGKVSVTLPKKYSKTITVKAKYLPKSTTTVTGKTSKTIKVTTKK
ncbi:MAG TPA: glycoside hydrolase family 76 protein [Cellulomonas sp.]|nr:glycoside hydrolase family 76 protein [Cellulomonas sp.]